MDEKRAVDPVSGQVHNAWLDWLRFLAALEVVLTHTRDALFLEYAKLTPESHTYGVMLWTALTRLGYEAVIVFFVLSGFLVGGRALQLARQRKFNIQAYAIDRIVRIQIPLLAAIALSTFSLWWTTGSAPPGLIIGNILSLQGAFVKPIPVNNPLWSLSYEVWFYIVGGAIAFLMTTRRFNLFAAIALVAAAIIFMRLNALYILLWFGGALAYQFKPAKPNWAVVAGGAVVTIAGVVLYQLGEPRTAYPAGNPIELVAGAGVMLAGMVLILPNLFVSKWNSGAMARLGTFLASFSYSLYLVHRPLLSMLPKQYQDSGAVTAGAVVLYVAMVGAMLLAAFIFSRAFETPGPAIKAWIKARIGGVRTQAHNASLGVNDRAAMR